MGLLSKLFGKKQEPSKSTPETGKSHIKVFKVAGVTFDDRQKIRQSYQCKNGRIRFQG